jgi:hypothetical protein
VEEGENKKAHLRIRHTTVVPALGVGFVLAVAVAAGGSAAHLVLLFLVICGSSQHSLSSSGTMKQGKEEKKRREIEKPSQGKKTTSTPPHTHPAHFPPSTLKTTSKGQQGVSGRNREET